MSLIQSARSLPLGCAIALLASAPAWAQVHDGDWTGSVKPPGQELHIVLHITTKPSGTEAVLDSVDQGVTIPAAAYKADGNKVSILFLAVGGELEGEFAADGQTLTGTWKQGLTLPLTLTRKTGAPSH